MPSFASSALRLLRKLLTGPNDSPGPYAGTRTVLDGNTAVAVTESGIGEAAGLGATYPADAADLAWRAQQQRLTDNLIGGALSSHTADSPRGALATAVGLSLSGVRATAFLSSADLASAQDLLASAAGRHLPLVAHLSNRALAGHASAIGSGHEAMHIGTDSGCFMLFAANVQEAVDFTLIARRVAEQTLIPGLVVMDGTQTALAMQDVSLPGHELVKRYLGDPDDSIEAPTPAQKLLFGDRRRRVPRWYNPDRPVLLGGMQSTSSWGLGKAADRPFFVQQLKVELGHAFTQFAQLTGRDHRAVSAYKTDDADLVLVAQGAAIETAEAVCKHLRSPHRVKVGVLGLRSLRPFPGARIAELLRGKQRVCVLERMDNPTAGAPPLMRELQATLGRALENGHAGAVVHADYPAMTAAESPRTLSVIYGLGGLPLRGADLIELCTGIDAINQAQIYLGLVFSPGASRYPKRQVLLDRLRRDYPEIASSGLTGAAQTPDLRPMEALTLAVHRISGQAGDGLSAEIAGLLQAVTEGRLRSHPAEAAEPWGGYCIDSLTCAPGDLRDPGAQMPVDLSVLLAQAATRPAEALAELKQDGLLLLEDAGPGTQLPAELVASLREDSIGLYRIAALEAPSGVADKPPPVHGDYLLGAVFGVLLDAELVDVKPRRLLSIWEQRLQSLPKTQREAHLDSFREGLERVHRLDSGSVKASPVAARSDEQEAPLAVRRLGGTDEAYDSLPRFWDQVGVLYRNGESGELTPDPYLASGAMPPLSSAFRDLSPQRDTLPALDPALCDGCAACWSRCPDGAVGAAALTPRNLLDAAIARTGTDALRPLVSKLAARISSRCAAPDAVAADLGQLLDEAWTWLQEKMPLPAERRQALTKAIAKLHETIACLPAVATEPFFKDKEKPADGDPELLFLAINPDACKGCGICVSACGPHALTSVAQSRKTLGDARQVWRAWEQLPDTLPGTLDKVANDPRLGPLAATLLTRRHTASLAGGDGAEPGSGERLALRLLMAVAESRQHPAVEAFVSEVRALKERISRMIRDTLANALPSDDLDALARGLETVESHQAELSDFIATAERSIDSGIDARRLRRLVRLAQDLEDLVWRLDEGRHGLGRAHLGMVLTAESLAGWAGVFPNNPFATPVAIELSGEGPQLAIGLLEGQLRQSTDGLALVRRARLELEHPQDAARANPTLEHLNWQDLTPEERAICPPLFVVGGEDLLRGGGLSQVDRLLGSDLPIKLLVLNELDLGLATEATLDTRLSAADAGLDIALLALARRQACIAQTSLAANEHLTHCLHTALAFDGPALVHLHAPSPMRHGFAPDQLLQRAERAVTSRVLPLFLYDPRADGVFGSRLSLQGNPQPHAHWAGDASEETPTPASWALGERRFAAYFTRLEQDAPEPMPVSDYLALDNAARAGKTPVVSGLAEDGSVTRFEIEPELIRICSDRLQAWRVLQELAGLVTPFTAEVEQKAREEVAAAHSAELDTLRAEYEAQIDALQGTMLEKTRSEMRERMMRLAGYSAGGKAGQGGGSN